MAGPGGGEQVPCKKKCVCGPFYGGNKIRYPLWWYGEQNTLYNFAGRGSYVVPANCAFMNHGYYFNGGSSYLLDEQNRKILREGTSGLWSLISLDGNVVPPCGSICGSGTCLYLNSGLALPPKIGGSLILHPQCCPNLTQLRCHNNFISVLDVSALTSLTDLRCYYNFISVLDVSALTSLTYLHCYHNSISVLDVSALTSLTYLNCGNNPISVLDVSALTSLTYLYCHNNSMDQAMVDTVLCDVDGYGTNNGVLNISGNAVPSVAGITCKNNLIARGWTVTTD